MSALARGASAIVAQKAQTVASYTGCPKTCKIDSIALGDALQALGQADRA